MHININPQWQIEVFPWGLFFSHRGHIISQPHFSQRCLSPRPPAHLELGLFTHPCPPCIPCPDNRVTTPCALPGCRPTRLWVREHEAPPACRLRLCWRSCFRDPFHCHPCCYARSYHSWKAGITSCLSVSCASWADAERY